MKPLFERLVAEALLRELPAVVPREVTVLRMPGKVSVLTGMRRTGKTWLCFQQMQYLLKAGIPRERMLYINFEDDRLAHIKIGDLQWLIEAFYAFNPQLKEVTCHLFFDEIQQITGWEVFIRRLLDTEQVEITLTGSSAKLLSREIGTAMRGRALVTEVFPLSFREYCRFHDITISEKGLHSAKGRLILARAAVNYLATGGFPEVQYISAPLWRTVLQDYADVVILRDVIERHGVTNFIAAKSLARHILQNPGQRTSISRLAATFSQAGIACSKNTLFDLLDHLHDAYFCFPVEIHDRSLRRRQVNPNKIYAIDTGICNAVSLGQTHDAGARLENAVYNALRARGISPDYVVTPRKTEVDFVYRNSQGWHFVQSCLSMSSPETAARELRGLNDAMELHKDASRLIVTLTDDFETDGVRVTPLWRWLLEMTNQQKSSQ